MLRNALPTEKSTALGTSGHRFAELMMVAALMCQILHGYLIVGILNLCHSVRYYEKNQPLQECLKCLKLKMTKVKECCLF